MENHENRSHSTLNSYEITEWVVKLRFSKCVAHKKFLQKYYKNHFHYFDTSHKLKLVCKEKIY